MESDRKSFQMANKFMSKKKVFKFVKIEFKNK